MLFQCLVIAPRRYGFLVFFVGHSMPILSFPTPGAATIDCMFKIVGAFLIILQQFPPPLDFIIELVHLWFDGRAPKTVMAFSKTEHLRFLTMIDGTGNVIIHGFFPPSSPISYRYIACKQQRLLPLNTR